MKTSGKILAISLAALCARAALAVPSITVDSVVQRWPWNNKIDITYTVGGGQNVAAGVYARIVFTANIGGASYTKMSTATYAAPAAYPTSGQHPRLLFTADEIDAIRTVFSDPANSEDFIWLVRVANNYSKVELGEPTVHSSSDGSFR